MFTSVYGGVVNYIVTHLQDISQLFPILDTVPVTF